MDLHILGYGNFVKREEYDVDRLTNLEQGKKAVVTGFFSAGTMIRRLQDMGLIEGTLVECVGKSPLGDPKAFLVRGAVIALREEDAGMVAVMECKPE